MLTPKSVFRTNENPHRIVGRPLHSKNQTAWIAIFKHGIIRPFYFNNNYGNAVTVIKEGYFPGLELFCGELEKCENFNEKEQLFKQDGTPPHTTNVTMLWLREKFWERLSSRRVEIE